MIDTDKYEGHTEGEWCRESNDLWFHRDGKDIQIADILIRGDGDERYHEDMANARLIADAPLLLAEVKRLREDYENMSEVLREHGMDICRHCRVIYRDDDMNHPHYPSLHPWHMDGMCTKEMKE